MLVLTSYRTHALILGYQVQQIFDKNNILKFYDKKNVENC